MPHSLTDAEQFNSEQDGVTKYERDRNRDSAIDVPLEFFERVFVVF